MSRITNTLRDSIITAVMSEIPNPLNVLQEQARDLVTNAAIAALPLVAQPAYKLHPTMFKTNYWNMGTHLGSVNYVSGAEEERPSWSSRQPKFLTESLGKKLTELEAKAKEAAASRRAATQSLHNSLYGLTTVKQLKETFPQFSKYLPVEMSGSTQPLNALMVTDTLNALRKLGWKEPKVVHTEETTTSAAVVVESTKPPQRVKRTAARRAGVNKK